MFGSKTKQEDKKILSIDMPELPTPPKPPKEMFEEYTKSKQEGLNVPMIVNKMLKLEDEIGVLYDEINGLKDYISNIKTYEIIINADNIKEKKK